MLHILLIVLFGLSIKFVNPFKMEIIGLELKSKDVIVRIRSIRFIASVISMLAFTVILDGVEVILRAKDDKVDQSNLKDHHNPEKNQHTADEMRESILGLVDQKSLCLFPKNVLLKQLIKWYLFYLRFINVKFMNVEVTHEQSGIKLTTELSNNRVQLSTKDDITSLKLSVRAFQQGINNVELFQAFSIQVSGILNTNCGDLSKVNVSLDLIGTNIPVYTLVKAIAPLKELDGEKTPKSSSEENVSEFTEHDYLIHVYKKLVIGSYFIKLIEKVSFSMHNVAVTEIPFATKDLALCQKYQPKSFIEFTVNSVSFSCSRMYFDYPGYGLLYKYEDKPYHFIYNLTDISLSLNNLTTQTTKEVMNVPVMNFTGHSNLAFQSLKAIRSLEFTKSKIDVIGHMSEPIIDLSTDEVTTAVMSAFDFLRYQHRIRSAPEYIRKQELLAAIKEESKLIREKMEMKFQKFWPVFSVKMGIESPTVMIKDFFNEKYSRILVLQHSLVSAEINSKREFKGDLVQYYTEEKFYAHHTRINFRDTYTDLERSIFKIDNVKLKQRYDILPKKNLQSALDFTEPRIDLSNIIILNGINYMFNQLDLNITRLFQNFMKHTDEFSCYCTKTGCSNPYTEKMRLQKERELETMSVLQIVNEKIPSWIHKLKITSTDVNCVLGSRSLLLPKEIMKSMESQSKCDLIEGKLRKIEFSADVASAEFIDQTSTGSESNIIQSAVDFSLDGDDDFGISDSSSEVSSEITFWKFRITLKKLVGKAITETTDQKDKLKDKVFLKVPNCILDLRPSSNGDDKLMLDCDIDRLESMYSVITHFLIASSFHLLRNTVFEALWNKLHPPKPENHKTEQLKKKKIKSPSSVKRILASVELGVNINFLDLILVMPSKLKSRFEITNVNVFGMMENPLVLNSDFIRICVESPTTRGYWARFATATEGTATIDITKLLDNGPASCIDFSNNVCHITIPNKLLMYQVFNNISLLIKTVKQLHHSLKYNTNDIILYPKSKPALKLPKMNLKSNRLVFSLEDDPFESELNMIFQIGLLEQRSRIAKMKIFDKELSDQLTKAKATTTKSQTFSASSAKSTSKKKECKFPTPDFDSFQQKFKNINLNVNSSSTTASHPLNNYHIEKLVEHTQSLSNMPTSGDHFKQHFQSAFDVQEDAQEKLKKLKEHFSDSWIRRVKNFKAKTSSELKESHDFLWGSVYYLGGLEAFNRKVLEFSQNPHLFTLIFEGVDLDVGPPSFGFEHIPAYIHDVGKGVPKDTEYSTLFPMTLDLRLSELRLHLRDYPLPLIHMPAVTKNQSSSLPAVRIHGDLIIAEANIYSHHEIREVYVRLAPGCGEFDEDDAYSIEIPKTLVPIKFFTSLNCDLNSELATKVTWGNSYQPCIHQIMASLDNFTKPPLDPSEKLGFWDKIRANFHARLRFNFNNSGEFHIVFKGSKNPYAVSGVNSGFVLGFKNNVIITCNDKDNIKEFITAKSEEIMFSVPNNFSEPFLVWCRPTHQSVFLTDPTVNYQRSVFGYYLGYHDLADPTKVEAMKLNYIQKHVIRLRGGTQLNFSVLFERKCPVDPTKRTTKSRPHYDIILCNPKYVEELSNYDAYKGFRSDYIHLEFQLVSTQKEAYNAIQLSPMAMQFFFKWWKMFSNSLPVRQGKLFGPGNHSKKFSRYLSTLKYQAIIEPLFITHVHQDGEVSVANHQVIECLGLKGRASRVVLDLHQRKELVFDHNETLDITRTTMKNKFNVGMVEIVDFDVRAVKSIFRSVSSFQDFTKVGGLPEKMEFKTYDEDRKWLDITDFVEIGVGELHDFKAKIFAYALMRTPRFIYIKKGAYGDKYQVDIETGERIEPFGRESFHDCLYDISKSSVETIVNSFNARISELEAKVEQSSIELDSYTNKSLTFDDKRHIQKLKFDADQIAEAIILVKQLAAAYDSQNPCEIVKESDFDFVIDNSIEDTSFTNSFIIHNMLFKWNDNTRDILYRYIYLIEKCSNLNKFEHAKSLCQVNEAIYAQNFKKDGQPGPSLTRTTTVNSGLTAERTQTRFSQETEDSRASERLKNFKEELRELAVNFFYKTHDNYKVRLVSPQIQLQSDENKNAAIVVTAPGIELNVIAFDSREDDDPDDDIFEQRFGIIFTDASIFMFHKNEVLNTSKLFFSSSSYGSTTAWPPWLGVELCYDSRLISDHVLLHKTTFVARYDKVVNTSFVGSQSNQANRFSVDLSQAVFLCDSKQYFSLYTVVLNLLIYNDSKSTKIKQREAKLFLKLDNKDLAGIKDRIVELQHSIKEANYVLESMTSRKAILDDVEHSDLFLVRDAIFEAKTELFLLMRVSLLSNTSALEKVENFMEWNVRADDIKLHMLDESRDPFLDLILFNSHFRRLERTDRSNRNDISIGSIEILNLDQDSNLPVLFSALATRHKKEKIIREADNDPLIHVSWQMENPVGGIRIMKKFDVKVLPIQISIEEATGNKLMEYAFPNVSPLFSNNDSDDLQDDDDSIDDHSDSESDSYSEETTDNYVRSHNNNERRSYGESEPNGITRSSGLMPIEEQTIKVPEEEGTIKSDDIKLKLEKTNGTSKHTVPSSTASNGKVSFSPRKRTFSLNSVSRAGSFTSKTSKGDDTCSKYSNGALPNKNSRNTWSINSTTEEQNEDEGVELMLERASTYLSIVAFSLKTSQISVTFRGTGAKRLVNVTDFIINVPDIVLFNKTCTFLDLVNELKKNVIKALLAHSGSLISNKLSKRDARRHLANISGYSSARIHTFRGDKFGKTISNYNHNYIEEYKKKGKFEELK